jgi:predicted RNA binding protein YcfA (HicA-like mRNA interferase family)
MRVREVIALVEADGWVLVRSRGDQRQYTHPTKPGLVTIAGNRNRDVPPGALANILTDERKRLMRATKRLKCWLFHRRTWKVMNCPHGRVQVYEFGCRRCSQIWYKHALSRGKQRIKR